MMGTTRPAARVVVLVLTSIAAGLSGLASQDAASQPASFGKWGLDLTSLDRQVKPGDDFFAYANGSYLARTEIPPDQASTGTGRDIFNRTEAQLRALIEASAAKPASPTGAQIGNLYRSF